MFTSDPTAEARRLFLKRTLVAAAAVMTGTFRGTFAAGDLPHLTDADPTAKAMDYVDDAATSDNKLYKPGNACANCQL